VETTTPPVGIGIGIDNFIATGIIRIKVQNRKLDPVQKEARRKS